VAGVFFGRRVHLGRPRRHGFRFAGRAPADWSGALARWGRDVAVGLGGAAPAGDDAMVVGRQAGAEYFTEHWQVADPVHVRADGIERVDYRLRRVRRASGFSPDGKGWYNTYGASLDLAFDAGAVRFAARR
jgi:hypothetical protein